jgi:hypothetical protein
MEHINTLCGQNAELCMLKHEVHTYSNQGILNGQMTSRCLAIDRWIKSTFLPDVTLCISESCRYFGGTYHLHLVQYRRLKQTGNQQKQATNCSTRCYSLDDRRLPQKMISTFSSVCKGRLMLLTEYELHSVGDKINLRYCQARTQRPVARECQL